MDYKYHATAERIIDGDTFLARVDLGFYIFTTIHVRIRGMNAPEMTGASRQAGAAARHVPRRTARTPVFVAKLQGRAFV
jgi:endonuclease YncB( thermonuclease family)